MLEPHLVSWYVGAILYMAHLFARCIRVVDFCMQCVTALKRALSLIFQPPRLVNASKRPTFILATTSSGGWARRWRVFPTKKSQAVPLFLNILACLSVPKWLFSKSWIVPVNASFLYLNINSRAVRLRLSHLVWHPYFIFNTSMVRVTRNSKTSARAAGCAPSRYTLKPRSSSAVPRITRGPIARSAVDRDKVRADAKHSKKGAEVKVRRHRSCVSKYGTISIPPVDLLNELPARVREEVETIKNCCLATFPTSPRHGDATPRFVTGNLHKHQLFSNEHAENLDPETRQWLPRLVCPAFPLSSKCHGQGQRSDSMLRHLEICRHFQALFPDEHRKLFPRAHDPKPPADHEYKILKMSLGQLEFLSAKLGKECRGKKRTFVSMSADAIRMVLRSWRPLSKPGANVVPPCDFPPVRMPQYFCATGVERAATEDERGEPSGYDADLDTSSSSSSNTPSPIRTPLAIADEDMQQDAPTPLSSSLFTPTPSPEPFYPELYLPPHLLPPTCDVSYLAAAIAAHAPEIDAFSPLLAVPITSLSAEIPRDCSVSHVAISEYDLAFFSRGGGVNGHAREYHHMIPQACEQFSQTAESGGLVFIA